LANDVVAIVTAFFANEQIEIIRPRLAAVGTATTRLCVRQRFASDLLRIGFGVIPSDHLERVFPTNLVVDQSHRLTAGYRGKKPQPFDRGFVLASAWVADGGPGFDRNPVGARSWVRKLRAVFRLPRNLKRVWVLGSVALRLSPFPSRSRTIVWRLCREARYAALASDRFKGFWRD
jgi:hypothetical protein